MRIMLLVTAAWACLLFSSCESVQTEEKWSIKKSEDAQKFESNFLRGNISDDEGGTQDDVDRLSNKSFRAGSDFDTSNLDYGEVETTGFLGGRKKSRDSSTRLDTKSVEPEMWKDGGRDYADQPEYGTSSASFASRNWKPRGDEYYHVSDLAARPASKSYETETLATGQKSASSNILVGRANEPVSAQGLQKKAASDPNFAERINTPAVSLDQVRQMLGRQ